MSKKFYKLEEHGDPQSELNVQRRLRWLRQFASDVPVNIPQDWIDRDPAFQKAIEEGSIRLPKERDKR